ncbi:MAG: hypothetical protein HOE38_00030 [Proteobacteria bacterium]|nr:hypothetical protein [Pseudomonadota bacterium]
MNLDPAEPFEKGLQTIPVRFIYRFMICNLKVVINEIPNRSKSWGSTDPLPMFKFIFGGDCSASGVRQPGKGLGCEGVGVFSNLDLVAAISLADGCHLLFLAVTDL